MEEKFRLLFVDDEAINLRAFRRTFGEAYDIITASSGAEALELLRSNEVDVAIVDHLMPKMNGVELIRRIKTTQPSLPCLIVTAYADFSEVTQASREGLVTTVINKPWKKEDLERWIVAMTRISLMRRTASDLKAWHKRTTAPPTERRS